MSDKSHNSREFNLPKIQMFYLFYVSLAFIVPMIHNKNLVGALTFLGIVVFYLLTEFKTLTDKEPALKKKLYIDCALMLLVGAVSSFLNAFFGLIGVILAIRAYKYVNPTKEE